MASQSHQLSLISRDWRPSLSAYAVGLDREDSRGLESPEIRGLEGAWGGVCI